MANENYNDNAEWSDTYDDGDAYVKQPPSAVFVTESIQQVNVAVGEKQNAIVLQPSNPPLNPKTGDMWIDNNVLPNIIYTWDNINVKWVKASATTADEVGAYTIAQVDGLREQSALDISAVSSRTDVTEGKLADGEGLASTITKTTSYTLNRDNAIDGKVNTLVTNLNNEAYVNDKIPTMVTTGILERKATEITAKFNSTGGVNLLKNSVGYAGLLNWQTVSGSFAQYIGNDAEAGSGLVATTGVIKQAITAVAGTAYTLTAKVKKGTAGTGYMKLSDGTNFQQVDMINTAAYNYAIIQISGFIPANNVLIVEIGGAAATGGIIFTSMMLNIGTLGLQWSNANGEVYNTAVQFDLNGVKVLSSVYDGYTVMSPQEFSGYFRNTQGTMQKVFTLNKDVTEVAKLKVTDAAPEINMGTMKLIGINSGGYSGWAFVPI